MQPNKVQQDKWTAASVAQRVSYDPLTGVITHVAGPKAGQSAVVKEGDGYTSVFLDGFRFKSHRIAWLLSHGEWPSGMIDHINRDRSDNRLLNLRVVERAENAKNAKMRTDNKSGHKGVSWHARGKKWRACYVVSGKQVYLGLYANKDDAIAAYLSAVNTAGIGGDWPVRAEVKQ